MTAPTPPIPTPPAATFNPWPASIVATFVVFVSATIALVVVSGKDRVDLVAPDYYEQEIRYQTRIDQLRRTEPFATEISAAFDPALRRIAVNIPAKHAAAGATGDVQLYRPDHAGADRHVALAADGNGTQVVPAADLKPGLWKARIRWKVGSDEFYADHQVIVTAPGDASGR
ncbi:MAG: FixH family protein [Verrucomicrobiales bacterium]|nr:FixH family protein [Verrucomicrobiales bacterium]